MKNQILYKILSVLITLTVFALQKCSCLQDYTCPTQAGDPMPVWPSAFATDIRVNYPHQASTVYVRQSVDMDGRREAIELWSSKRHVKYIRQNDTVLFIQYKDEGLPTCTVKSSSFIQLEDKDAGPRQILNKLRALDSDKFFPSDSFLKNGVYLRVWEACVEDIKVVMGYTESNWAHPITSPDSKKKRFFDYAEALIGDDSAVLVTDNFSPTMPADVEFQPPENVFCDGFGNNQKPPNMPNFFSYDAEMIVFESSEGIAPMVHRRKVFHDFPSKLVRTDFYDPLAENQDVFSKITAKGVSIIHDFNSSTQYNIDPVSGKCYIDDYIITVDVAEVKETKSDGMLTGNEFFSLDTRKISYNGQFMTRGYLADVYTGLVSHLDGEISKGKSLYTWYFSAVRTQIVENDKIDRNVLLRMVIQPENIVGYEGRIDVNFYNFRKEEPNPSVYDISGCFNESFSKTFVLTFPANPALKEIRKYLKLHIHLALLQITGLSKQRVLVNEVNFNKDYMFAEFKLLDSPYSIKSKAVEKETTLAEAISKIKTAISESKFEVSITVDEEMLALKPLADGFNELSGDRRPAAPTSYKEGSVIALTIGMLFLGFLLGSVTLNLIISRKYGVSLFQKSNSGANRFENALESSM